jgi:hypothetical protein
MGRCHSSLRSTAPSWRLCRWISAAAGGGAAVFLLDGQYDNHGVTVGTLGPADLAGARVLYAGAGENASIRECPAGIQPYPGVELAAEPVVTFPGFEHPDLQAAFGAPGEDLRSFLNHPVNEEALLQALTDRRHGPAIRSVVTLRRCKARWSTRSPPLR